MVNWLDMAGHGDGEEVLIDMQGARIRESDEMNTNCTLSGKEERKTQR